MAPTAAHATFILFTATLTGSQEVPPNASTAIGLGSVLLDDVLLTITVNESWTGLMAPATNSHIHGPAPPGVSAPVIFPLALGGGAGATSGVIPQQVFAITLAQIIQLDAGLFYLNIHDSIYNGGEIRGQLLRSVPEPATFALVGLGLAALGFARRKTN